MGRKRGFGGGGGEKTPPKPVKHYELIDKSSKEGKQVFALIDEVREKWRDQLGPAAIGAGWRLEVKPDKDGRLDIGRLLKTSELQRQIHGLDAIVVLNREFWNKITDSQKLAVIHHQLCHLEPIHGRGGDEQAVDGHDQPRWRLRRHDLEEFREVVAHHGCYVADIAAFVETTVKKDPNLDLFNPNANKAIGEDILSGAKQDPRTALETCTCGHTDVNHKKKTAKAKTRVCLASKCGCENFVARALPVAPDAPAPETAVSN